MFTLTDTFGQTITKKNFAGKWNTNLRVDSVKTGDTIVFKSNVKFKNFYLKSNGQLKQNTFSLYPYGHCGNKTFRDYFTPKTPDWTTVGSWGIETLDKKTFLSMIMDRGNSSSSNLTFLFVSHDKDQFILVFQDMLTVRGR